MRRRWPIALALLLGAVLVTEYTAERYIDDVLSGKQVVCKYVRLAMERHVRDLERQGDDDFPYVFDQSGARRVIDFKQQLVHVEGEWKGARIHLEPWQQAKDWILFGWRRVESGYRRFRKALIAEARKNGKTTDAVATALYCFYADRPQESGPQQYFLGPKKVQGKYGWSRAAAMIKACPALKRRASFYKEKTNEPVVNLRTDELAVMTVWGRDAEKQDGFNPSFALVDEAHLYPGNEAMEVVESGMGARRQPLTCVVTTAGFDMNSPCYIEEWSLAVGMLEGTRPMLEHFFALIYTLDEGDDPFEDPSCWIKANPNLGISCRLDHLQERVTEALSSPTKINGVLTKNFNIWTQAETRWIAPEAWAACTEGPVDEEALVGRPFYGGLDLSTSIDITAWVLCFPPLPGESGCKFLFRFFIPEDGLLERERRDHVPYGLWAKQGLITKTPGATIDFDMVEEQIRADAGRFEFMETAYDEWKAPQVVNHLEAEGLEMIAYRQGFTGMAEATDLFEKAVLSKEIEHGGNPVMVWMVACTEVKGDRYGNIIPQKPERNAAGKRIDGVVGAIMSHHLATTGKRKRSLKDVEIHTA